jgi:hypothetical protein
MDGESFWFRVSCASCSTESPKITRWGEWPEGWTAPVRGQAQTFRCPVHGADVSPESAKVARIATPPKRSVFDKLI